MRKTAVIWGAGKIGRGFLAEVLIDSGYNVVLVDIDRALACKLREAGSYGIYKADSSGIETVTITGYEVLHATEKEKIAEYLAMPGTIVGIAVMASDLKSVIGDIASLLPEKLKNDPGGALDIVLCINMLSPAEAARDYLCGEGGFITHSGELYKYCADKVGFVETVVLRTAPDPTPEILEKDPLAALNNGYPELIMDAKAFKGAPPRSDMIRLAENIHAEEVRKIYTINMAHALMCYLGAPLGLTETSKAICDARIRPDVFLALGEAMEGIWGEFAFLETRDEWLATVTALLENEAIGDTLARLGADVPRKVGGRDRLVGPALLCMKHGKEPHALAKAIAAAYRYTGPGSNSDEIQATIASGGISAAITRFSGMEPSHPLHGMVLGCYNNK